MTTSSPTISAVVDNLMIDEVMKRRLLIDGDGAGDDRRILNLTKSFLTFCAEDSPEEMSISKRKILNQLATVEHASLKTRFSIKANEEAKKMYLDVNAQIKNEIEMSREEIESSKQSLELAKEQRKQRTEYSALARLIQNQPDRKETEQKRLLLEKQLAELKAKETALSRRLDNRKRSMHVLVAAIGRLNDMINEEAVEEQQAIEEAEKSAREAAQLPAKHVSVPGVAPMEVDEAPVVTAASNPGSPLEQRLPEASSHGESRPVLGTVSSAPVSPGDPAKEKYDEVSDSD